MIIPASLRESCSESEERRAWLLALPHVVDELRQRWSVTLGPPFDGDDVSCSWVAPAVRADGTRAVLKVGLPHFEGAHEIEGLRFWNGDPTVFLLEADDTLNAMLLERCEPGSSLREVDEAEQDIVIASLLRRIWRSRPKDPHVFRPLSTMIAHWMQEADAARPRWSDPALVRAGRDACEALLSAAGGDVLLVTDLHAGNVLRATREPWLAIDPKPFVGDPAYDGTQHLLNCRQRMLREPRATVDRFAAQLDVDAERLRLWMFARAAAEPRDDWNNDWVTVARALQPS